MKTLPEIIDPESRKRAQKFERGLSGFLERTLRKSFGSFKN